MEQYNQDDSDIMVMSPEPVQQVETSQATVTTFEPAAAFSPDQEPQTGQITPDSNPVNPQPTSQWMNKEQYATTSTAQLPPQSSGALRAFYVLLAIAGFIFFVAVVASLISFGRPSQQGGFNVFSVLSAMMWLVPLILLPAGICGTVQRSKKGVRTTGIVIIVLSSLWLLSPVVGFLLLMALFAGGGV
jgi:hypothetical protein